MGNQSIVTEFLLMGFADDHETQILHLVIFLFVYLTAVVGNLLIIMAVALDHYLHNPMYFFLVHLSFLDLCFISTTVPKSIAISITQNRAVTFTGCAAQLFLIVTYTSGELFLLTAMAYDRYVAICHPLQYSMIMNWNACIQMASAAWISSLIHAVVETSLTFRVNFCGSNKIRQFFCDMPLLQKISCADSNETKRCTSADAINRGGGGWRMKQGRDVELPQQPTPAYLSNLQPCINILTTASYCSGSRSPIQGPMWLVHHPASCSIASASNKKMWALQHSALSGSTSSIRHVASGCKWLQEAAEKVRSPCQGMEAWLQQS
ncbi:PREDICTED: olfactory receptor 14A16-like [Thamnophis sirtalis]|uniref:Olfactory receptor n=1 Tax=Thamnophis sirtalis TaxID=35019 RepID=A0A6I9YSG2_9SAUR|nr:PREDICTED: olfactory receptor 14A16-like [Thamnophis sirtalis]